MCSSRSPIGGSAAVQLSVLHCGSWISTEHAVVNRHDLPRMCIFPKATACIRPGAISHGFGKGRRIAIALAGSGQRAGALRLDKLTDRSEESREGKEGVCKWRSGWSPYN